MRLVTFVPGGHHTPRVGGMVEGVVVDLAAAFPDLDVPDQARDLIAAGSALWMELSRRVAAGAPEAATHPSSEVTLMAPLRPGKIVGVGLNYLEHVDESSRTLDTDRQLPTRPVLFSKPATAVIGPEQAIRHNAALTAQLDWECELAVVVGATAFEVPVERAYEFVFGYCVLNDISARDQRRSGQWFYSKGQDTYAPLGPVVVPISEIADPHALELRLTVNGEQMQLGSTSQMLFRIPQLIADITSGMTLEPGDVIATGSPQGVGAAQDPPRFLVPGDVVEASIESIGTLRNPVVAAGAPA